MHHAPVLKYCLCCIAIYPLWLTVMLVCVASFVHMALQYAVYFSFLLPVARLYLFPCGIIYSSTFVRLAALMGAVTRCLFTRPAGYLRWRLSAIMRTYPGIQVAALPGWNSMSTIPFPWTRDRPSLHAPSARLSVSHGHHYRFLGFPRGTKNYAEVPLHLYFFIIGDQHDWISSPNQCFPRTVNRIKEYGLQHLLELGTC